MNYFQQVNGSLVLVNSSATPFQDVMEQTLYRRPVMADWNADGRMDLLLMPKVFPRMQGSWFNAYDCAVLLYLQLEEPGPSLQWQSNSVFLNEDCKYFKASGLSLVDVDGDGDLDVVFGGFNAPLSVFEHKVSNGSHFLEARKKAASSLIDLNQVDLGNLQDLFGLGLVVANFFKPTLVDWDLDGDLDLALVQLEKSRFFEQRDGKVVEVASPPSNFSCPLDWRLDFSTADFDGDGLLDLLGFDENYGAVVCVRQGSDFVALETHPFRRELEAMENRAMLGFPSFLDWDGDGDVDVLKIEGDRLYLIENLGNSSFLRQLLPVPMARDFVAADFDGDGDVDLMMAFFNTKGCHYFERTGDGSLERLHGSDNPFEGVCEVTSTAAGNSLSSLATIGDWNQDGLLDLVVVYEQINLWLNEERKDFVGLVSSNDLTHFPEAALQSKPRVSLVDADGDGDLDLVVPPQKPVSALGDARYRYFEHLDSGGLVERLGVVNPFHGAPPGDADMATNTPQNHMIVDVDGDGDLDIVRGYLQYAQQQGDGQFVFLEGADNPFAGVALDRWDCWTLADFDEDSDMDLVVVEVETNLTMQRLLMQEYLAGRMEKDDFLAAVASKVRFYEQVNSTFTKQVGAANPFRNMTLTADLVGALCPTLVDLDQDGDLDLILEDAEGHLLFYQQGSSGFEILPGHFSEVSIRKRHNRKDDPRASHFVDWDGDGLMDLVNFEGDALQYFQRGVCSPVASYCKLGLCRQQALKSYKCECVQGAEGDDCSLCGEHHVREGNACKKCPGYKTLAGTCSRRGTCDDDSDARERQRNFNQSGFKVWSAIGTGECTCIAPFHGRGCREGLCPPGQRLERDAVVEQISPKYPRWDACVPCEAGRYKNHTGNEECSICPAGFISPTTHALTYSACPPGHVPMPDRLRCRRCDAGYVAEPGDPDCRPCPAGSAPDAEGGECVKCGVGKYAEARSSKCSFCAVGWVPDTSDDRGRCKKCDGQTYALPGDESCKTCFFPAMILADENLCSPMYSVLFLLLFIILLLVAVGVYSWLRLRCLKRKMDEQVEAERWEDLHSLSTSCLEYGICRGRADGAIEARKEEVKLESLQLGICLNYVFQDLDRVYEDTARQAEWRQEDCELTKSGYFAKNRSRSIQELERGWSALPLCQAPQNPNFHQVAGILAYGPWALGKNQCCPRDGKMDCSIVDALRASRNSSKATWFLSWVWSYKLLDVHRALERWWDTQAQVSGREDCTEIFIWWCVFVNNQFRMLEGNQVEEPEKLFSVFGKQLKGIGKMLMCFDKLSGCAYTTRIWCIFEVFVACTEEIPTTLILPDVQVTGVNTLGDLTQECRVNAEAASAYFAADAEAIKKRIKEKHKGFRHVNQTVEKELWCEVIKYLDGRSQPPTTAAPVTAVAPPAAMPVGQAPGVQDVSEQTEVLQRPRPTCCLQ
ncbi:unnamed protein product [Effrenium voratum]|nr:unnamed protein product [Effrenium voratum]